MSGGPITQYVQDKKFSEERTKFYAAELVLALLHLHSNGIAYQNLIPSKILLDRQGHLKITQKIQVNTTEKGSQLFLPSCEFMAPEILEGKDIGLAADWWSLGVIIFYFLTGTTPFDGSSLEKIIENIFSGKLNIPSNLSTNAQSIVKDLLTLDEEERVKVGSNIKQHDFFSTVNWENMLAKKEEPPFKPIDESRVFDYEMSDTIVMPNIPDTFTGYTYVSPSFEHLMQN